MLVAASLAEGEAKLKDLLAMSSESETGRQNNQGRTWKGTKSKNRRNLLGVPDVDDDTDVSGGGSSDSDNSQASVCIVHI